MIVRNVARGHSFKKLAAYLTSPKEGQHRALWSATENLAASDPKTAAKIMAYIAQGADEIKAAQGVKATGRKAKDGPVYHIVLSWAEGQQPERDHQLEAARGLLETIGLDKAQALIVAHNDNGKEHVHVMVNLVDPETGKRFSLSNDQHRMQEWALAYERANGGVMLERRAERAEKWAQGEPQDKAERIPRPAMDRAERAQRKAWGEFRAARETAYTRQRDERGDLRQQHSQQWAEMKREAADHRAAYKAAFRAAYAVAKAEDKAANRPLWRDLFKQQKAERASVARQVDLARADAVRARQIAQKATRATVTAERRSHSFVGKAVQLLGLAATPEQAATAQVAAAAQMERAALALAQAELAKAGMTAKQDSARGALAKALGEVTFAKAQLAVDTLPRADFDALIKAQDSERRRLIEAHNAERATLGMKPYEPKTHRKDDPMKHDLAEQDKARRDFAQTADRRQTREQGETTKAQGAGMAPHPAGTKSYGTTSPAAPDSIAQKRDAAEKAAADKANTSFKGYEADPRRSTDTKPLTLAEMNAARKASGQAVTKEEAAKAAAAFAKANPPSNQRNPNDRDDFER